MTPMSGHRTSALSVRRTPQTKTPGVWTSRGGSVTGSLAEFPREVETCQGKQDHQNIHRSRWFGVDPESGSCSACLGQAAHVGEPDRFLVAKLRGGQAQGGYSMLKLVLQLLHNRPLPTI
jgi:hypothetical protein